MLTIWQYCWGARRTFVRLFYQDHVRLIAFVKVCVTNCTFYLHRDFASVCRQLCYWHCPHSMQSRVCAAVGCPSHRHYCRFGAVGPTARRYWSIAARPAVSSSRAAALQAAANAGSAMLSADAGYWAQSCFSLMKSTPDCTLFIVTLSRLFVLT